jgi:hypothetical protein
MPVKNKIFDGADYDTSFKPSSRVDPYKIEPASIFEHDPMEVGVESLSLHDTTRKNIKGNPSVVEGYGKIDYKKLAQTPKGTQVEDSNRTVPGHPELIKSSGLTSTSIMDPETELIFNKPSASDSNQSSAEEILRRAKPMVFRGGSNRSQAASSSVVDKLIVNVKESCDNVRAPQDWKSFERNEQERHALAQSAIPFEPWASEKIENFSFDPNAPYRPKQIDFSAESELPAPKMKYSSFNRTAKCFGFK